MGECLGDITGDDDRQKLGNGVKSITMLIDWENFRYSLNNLGIIDTEAVIREIIAKARNEAQVIDIRLFVPNYQYDSYKYFTFNELQLKYGITIELCPVLDNGKRRRETVDARMMYWVEQYLHPECPPQKVVLITGDGDYLLTKNIIQNKGKEAEFWIVNERGTSHYIKSERSTQKITPITPSKENPYVALLSKLNKEEPLTEEERKRAEILLKVVLRLENIKESVSYGTRLDILIEGLINRLNEGNPLRVDKKEIYEIIQALFNFCAVRVCYSLGSSIRINNCFYDLYRKLNFLFY